MLGTFTDACYRPPLPGGVPPPAPPPALPPPGRPPLFRLPSPAERRGESSAVRPGRIAKETRVPERLVYWRFHRHGSCGEIVGLESGILQAGTVDESEMWISPAVREQDGGETEGVTHL
ncbi:uncharacterized protein LOC133370937 [Rhineura floridana]|uniref:uncharacterized protein LOC133370937 n=1 Tax=Rhineura floridana TaxID=261503 RepID=UPI002AC7FF1B|nr:uncharacterized protein LOC133370937 [Rhineura floridana]